MKGTKRIMILLSQEETMKAVALLEKEMPDLAKELREMTEDTENVALFNRNHYFASVLWQEDDIIEALIRCNIEPTKENINRVLTAGGKFDGMKDCSYGWECLYTIIVDEFE